MNIIVKKDGKIFTIQKAIELGYVEINGNSIIPQGSSKIYQSTNLFDLNGKEIYVGDIIVESHSKKEYEVIQFYASVFIKCIENKNECIIETITSYKLGNRLDFYIK